MSYTRANTDWLAACSYGIGFHWTAQTVPRHGTSLSFQDAVDRFRLAEFMSAIDESGAEYVIFTATHTLHMLSCPHPVVDSILPGRTTQRDLLGEIADELAQRGKHLIVYYNHSCNQGDDPEWEHAVGYHDTSKNRFAVNLRDIVAYMGSRYGDKLEAWWFDSSYSLDPRGPNNTVTTDLKGFQFPWERWTEAAKTGLAVRLVTYNAGVNQTFRYTSHQDYWAGEMADLSCPPTGRYAENGLQWHGWTCLDERRWVHKDIDTEAPALLYSDDELVSFLSACKMHKAPMCFNVTIFQDGAVSRRAVEQLHRVGKRLEKMAEPAAEGDA